MEQEPSLHQAFEEALDASPEARVALVAALRVRDEAMANRLEAMLAAVPQPRSTVGMWAKPRHEALRGLPELAPQTTIGTYRILRELGRGGVACVYLALDEQLGRKVALKVSFVRGAEPQLLARLPHRHIVQALSAFRDEERSLDVLVLQYVAGPTWQKVLEGGLRVGELLAAATAAEDGFADAAPPPREGAQVLGDVATQLLEALAFAHDRGVLHLDVKPSNVFLDLQGRAVLADFNVARETEWEDERPIGGTERYMAPEQRLLLSGGPGTLDGRADLFALGVMLDETARVLGASELSEPRRRWIAKLHAHRADDRPSSAKAALESLQRVLRWEEAERRQNARRAESRSMRLAWSSPLAASFAGALIPNMMGSALQIAYNQLHIVAATTTAQRALFMKIVGPWNVFVFSFASYLLYTRYLPLRRGLASAATRAATNPTFAAVLTVGGWTMGCSLFVGALGGLVGPMAPELVAHFVVSFAAAALLSAAYTRHALAFVSAVAWLPRLLDPEASDQCRADLRTRSASLRRQLRRGRFFAATLPLVSAAIVVVAGPTLAALRGYPFQGLVVAFLFLSSVGFFWTNRLTELGEASLDDVCSVTH